MSTTSMPAAAAAYKPSAEEERFINESDFNDADATYQRVIDAFKARGLRIREYRDHAEAQCPLHPTKKRCFTITHPSGSRTGKVIVNCLKCGRGPDAIAALALTMADLIPHRRFDMVPMRPRAVAHYDYLDADGAIVARKVRMQPKSFYWLSPDPSAASGWCKGFGAVPPTLYWGGVWPRDVQRLFVVEGEKAVDLLRSLGLAAVCGATGAAKWNPAWTSLLLASGAKDIVVLGDNDKRGRWHAYRVARSLIDARAQRGDVTVRLIPAMPGTRDRDDVYDWLKTGRFTHMDLLALADVTPDRQDVLDHMNRVRVARSYRKRLAARVALSLNRITAGQQPDRDPAGKRDLLKSPLPMDPQSLASTLAIAPPPAEWTKLLSQHPWLRACVDAEKAAACAALRAERDAALRFAADADERLARIEEGS